MLYFKYSYEDLIEFIIARLRYFLGGDRPSQTTHYPLLINKLF